MKQGAVLRYDWWYLRRVFNNIQQHILMTPPGAIS